MGILSKVIGILGTAKNTGKTTTANFLLEWANREKMRVGLTSIGYDGEDIDNITGLPKPRILIQKDNIIATAEQCIPIILKDSLKLIEKTPINTALGSVVIGKALKKRLVVLAGPNKGKDLQSIIQKIKQQQAQLILVDGALNRMMPLVYCDALVLTTGAARHTDINLLVDEIESMSKVFSLPLREGKNISNEEIKSFQNNIVIIKKNDGIRKLSGHSLLNQKTFSILIDSIRGEEPAEIYIPGIIQDKILKKISEKHFKLFQGKTILIDNPILLLVGTQDIYYFKNLLSNLSNRDIAIKTLTTIPVLAITINPFYPKYSRYGKENYEMAYIDSNQLYQKMKEKIPFPIINIIGEDSEKLLFAVKEFMNVA